MGVRKVVVENEEEGEEESRNEELELLLRTCPVYKLKGDSWKADFPIPQPLPKLRDVFAKNIATRKLVENFMI